VRPAGVCLVAVLGCQPGTASPLRDRLERLLGCRIELHEVVWGAGAGLRIRTTLVLLAARRRERVILVAPGAAGYTVAAAGHIDVPLTVTTAHRAFSWFPGSLLPVGHGKWLHMGAKWLDWTPGAVRAPLEGSLWESSKAAVEIAFAYRGRK
jgi:hypothetical protein